MTNRISTARLTVSEPWDQSKSIYGILEEINILNSPELYFLGDDNRKYRLSLRYKESQVEEIWKGKHIIVNIEEFSESQDTSSPVYKSPFEGVGSIELIKPTTS